MAEKSVSRRAFLGAAGAGAASIALPGKGLGYTAADLLPHVRGDALQLGVSKWELETPALCVDIAKLEANLAQLERVVRANGIRARPHAKTHKTPAIGKLQMQAGALGLCVAKLGEAEVMLEAGLGEILLTTVNYAPSKIRRAMALRLRHPGFVQSVDNPQNARDLSAAAVEAGVVADVVVDVSPGTRTGIPAAGALELAQLVDRLPGLRLRGMEAYSPAAQHLKGFGERRAFSLNVMAESAEVYRLFQRSGLSTEIYSGGGTGTYNIDHEVPGFTDVQAGSYVFMDCQYLAIGGARDAEVFDDFQPSLTLLTSVLNTNFPGRATADAGTKALTLNEPGPIIVGERGISYRPGSDEFGNIVYGADPSRTYRPGDKLELIISHCDPVVNLYDHMFAIRGDRVEAIWPIAARGKGT